MGSREAAMLFCQCYGGNFIYNLSAKQIFKWGATFLGSVISLQPWRQLWFVVCSIAGKKAQDYWLLSLRFLVLGHALFAGCVTRCKVNLRQEKQSPQTRLPRCRRPGLCRRMHTFTSPPSTLRLYMCVHFTLWESGCAANKWMKWMYVVQQQQQPERPAAARRKLRLSVTHSQRMSLVQRWHWTAAKLVCFDSQGRVGYDFCEWTRDVDDTSHSVCGVLFHSDLALIMTGSDTLTSRQLYFSTIRWAYLLDLKSYLNWKNT